MSTTLEAPPFTPPPSSTPRVPPRASRWQRFRAESRLARRAVWRSKGSSVLVVALVALPVAMIAGAAVFFDSRTPTLEQEVTRDTGGAQAKFMTALPPGDYPPQSPTDPLSWYEVATPAGDDDPWAEIEPVDVATLVPGGTRVIEISRTPVDIETQGGVGTVDALVGEAWDPALGGEFELLSGDTPADASEVMVSPGVLDRTGASVGDELVMLSPEGAYTISGTFKPTASPDDHQVVVLPPAAVDVPVDMWTQWYTPDWQPSADELAHFNAQGVLVFARDLMLERAGPAYVSPDVVWLLTIYATLAFGFAGYLVVLLAGAAFSVSARRQQHAFAVAVSVGASRSSIMRVVLLQGALLGLIGGAIGAVAGVAGAYPALVLFDDGAERSFWGFHVPWWGIVGAAIFALAVGTISALMPARAATRGDVLVSLRGARRPVRMNAKRPVIGVVVILGGLAITVASAVALAMFDPDDYDNPLRIVLPIGIAVGPVVLQLGVIFTGRALLWLVAKALARVGLAPRIASRDAFAAPDRVVPAFAAIGACVFIASFVMSVAAIDSASAARNYFWSSPPGTLLIAISSAPENSADMEQRARDVIELASPDRVAEVATESFFLPIEGDAQQDERATFRVEAFDYEACTSDDLVWETCIIESEAKFGSTSGVIAVIDRDDLSLVYGGDVPEPALEAFDRGGAVVLDAPFRAGTFVQDGVVTVNAWRESDVHDPAVWTADGAEGVGPLSTSRLPAVQVDGSFYGTYPVVISVETAERIGLDAVPTQLIAAFDTPPTQAELDAVHMAQSSDGAGQSISARFETGPESGHEWILLVLGAAGALVVAAAAITLGLARIERRPDDATLSAVGGAPMLRRNIAFWQGLIIVGLGSVTGTIAGLIPVWGVAQVFSGYRLDDAPWTALAVLAFGFPLVIAAANWAVKPRRPQLTRRTAIA